MEIRWWLWMCASEMTGRRTSYTESGTKPWETVDHCVQLSVRYHTLPEWAGVRPSAAVEAVHRCRIETDVQWITSSYARTICHPHGAIHPLRPCYHFQSITLFYGIQWLLNLYLQLPFGKFKTITGIVASLSFPPGRCHRFPSLPCQLTCSGWLAGWLAESAPHANHKTWHAQISTNQQLFE